MNHHFLTNAKAYCALVGAICVGLLGVYGPETPVGQVLTVVSILATAVVTWRIPNQPDYSAKILGKAVVSSFGKKDD